MSTKAKRPVNAWMRKPQLADVAFALMTAKAQPDGTVTLQGVALDEIVQLGVRIMAAQTGRIDASDAIPEMKRPRGKPSRDHECVPISITYYGRLAREGAGNARQIAKDLAKQYVKHFTTIERIARKNQDWALDELERDRVPGVAALRAHLQNKSKGGNRPK